MFSKAALPPVELKQEKTGIFPSSCFTQTLGSWGCCYARVLLPFPRQGGGQVCWIFNIGAGSRDFFTCFCSSGHRLLPLDCWSSQTGIFLKASKFVAICPSLCVCAPHDSVQCAHLELPGDSAEGTNPELWFSVTQGSRSTRNWLQASWKEPWSVANGLSNWAQILQLCGTDWFRVLIVLCMKLEDCET